MIFLILQMVFLTLDPHINVFNFKIDYDLFFFFLIIDTDFFFFFLSPSDDIYRIYNFT
jgi:hypothetical protein